MCCSAGLAVLSSIADRAPLLGPSSVALPGSAVARGKKPKFLVSSKCHPQTIAVCKTRADGLGLKVRSDVAENKAGRRG